MAKGRPRKPFELHVFEGTNKPSRQGTAEEQVSATGKPAPPADMSPGARAVWDAVLPQIAGWVRMADSLALASFCQWYAWHKTACDKINASKKGGTSHQRSWAERTWVQCDKIAARFGMSPADRAKLRVTGGEKPKVPTRQRA